MQILVTNKFSFLSIQETEYVVYVVQFASILNCKKVITHCWSRNFGVLGELDRRQT